MRILAVRKEVSRSSYPHEQAPSRKSSIKMSVTFSTRSACVKEMRGGQARGSEWITARSGFQTDPFPSEKVTGPASAAAEQRQRLQFLSACIHESSYQSRGDN